ncbi:MAG: hypothetical protein R2939_02395 [Kofleriaceae bacterium]
MQLPGVVASSLGLVVTLTGATAADPFVTTDRSDAGSSAGAGLAYVLLDRDDTTMLAIDLHGQVTPRGREVGGYASLPIVHVDGAGADATALGNLDLGVVYAPRRPGAVHVILRGGLTLPTASDDLGDFFATAYGLAGTRLTDFVLALPEGVVLRPAASVRWREGHLLARADLGIDVPLANAGSTADPLLRLNLAAGYDAGAVTVGVELSSLFATGDDDDSTSNLALSVRGRGGARPYGALVVPLGDAFGDVIDAGLLVGVDVPL